MRNEEDKNVSEDMLRMVVAEAQRTEGIETGSYPFRHVMTLFKDAFFFLIIYYGPSLHHHLPGEGRMIKAVLDMQDKEVEKIMQPRIEIVALPVDAPATDILKTVMSTKYSRIPIFKGGIDNIIGVVFSKDLLLYTQVPDDADAGAADKEKSLNNYPLVCIHTCTRTRSQPAVKWLNLCVFCRCEMSGIT
jgi:CBS domain-containing protein